MSNQTSLAAAAVHAVVFVAVAYLLSSAVEGFVNINRGRVEDPQCNGKPDGKMSPCVTSNGRPDFCKSGVCGSSGSSSGSSKCIGAGPCRNASGGTGVCRQGMCV